MFNMMFPPELGKRSAVMLFSEFFGWGAFQPAKFSFRIVVHHLWEFLYLCLCLGPFDVNFMLGLDLLGEARDSRCTGELVTTWRAWVVCWSSTVRGLQNLGLPDYCNILWLYPFDDLCGNHPALRPNSHSRLFDWCLQIYSNVSSSLQHVDAHSTTTRRLKSKITEESSKKWSEFDLQNEWITNYYPKMGNTIDSYP
jgi:hypothetical protein